MLSLTPQRTVFEEQSFKVKKAHLRLMRHPETCLYSGVIMMGKSEVEDKDYTAYTDGKNKKYSAVFLEKLDIEEVTGLVFHENLHVTLKHLLRYKWMLEEDAQLGNAAMDYVVNDIIMSLVDKTLCKLPAGGCYDPKFHNWSVLEVWDYLKTGKHNKNGSQGQGNPTQGQGTPAQGTPQRNGNKITIGGETYSIGGMDEHDIKGFEGDSPDEIKKLTDEVDEAIRQGGMMAGRYGTKMPRAVTESLEAVVDWKRETDEFFCSMTRGTDELSWRGYNRKRICDGFLIPISQNEKLGDWVIAIDVSGSISNEDVAYVSAELQLLCDKCNPDSVRVLWWDTQVCSEQYFEGEYQGLVNLLKPVGGGGTRVGCVSDYIVKNNIKADCLLVMTDGYVEGDIQWEITAPSLWLVKGNDSFIPPSGRKVNVPAFN